MLVGKKEGVGGGGWGVGGGGDGIPSYIERLWGSYPGFKVLSRTSSYQLARWCWFVGSTLVCALHQDFDYL